MSDYTERLDKIEAEIKIWLPEDSEAAEIKNIFPFMKEKVKTEALKALFRPGADIILRGGKRWRPLLMTLVCETLGGGDNAIPLAPLVEFSHNASLIHDDIEDDSDERRGKPAVHKIYGVDTAINSGSFLYFLSLSCIEAFKAENKGRIYRLWAEHLRKLHLGQAMDIRWHRDVKYIPSMDDYYIMCGLKTGALARLAVELGAFSAGASDKTALFLSEAAEKLGIGFQVLDDLKNLTTGIPGKKRGDDIVEGKKSLPVIMYLNKYPEKREMIFFLLSAARINGAASPEIEEVIETLTAAGVLEEAQEKADSLVKEAREIFKSPQYAGSHASEEGRALLEGLISMIS